MSNQKRLAEKINRLFFVPSKYIQLRGKMLSPFKKKFKRYRRNKNLNLLIRSSILILIVILLGAGSILLFEYKDKSADITNFFDAVWWSLVTITTVGYGDMVPVTFWGRIIGIIFILLGFISFSIFTAFIASGFIDNKIKARKGLNKIKEKNHIVICGWNGSTNKILKFINNNAMHSYSTIALINELDEERFAALQNTYPDWELRFIKGDFTSQEIQTKANIKDAKQIILMYDESKPNSPPSDERTIIAAHNIIYSKVKGKISLQLKDEKYLPNIRRDKIHNVVIFDDVGGNLLANSTINPSIPDFIQEILKFKDGKGFNEAEIPSDYQGKTFGELFSYMKEKKTLIVLGIVSMQAEFSIDKILSEDSSDIDSFIKRQFEKSNKKFKVDESKNFIKIKPEDSYVIQPNDRAIVL